MFSQTFDNDIFSQDASFNQPILTGSQSMGSLGSFIGTGSLDESSGSNPQRSELNQGQQGLIDNSQNQPSSFSIQSIQPIQPPPVGVFPPSAPPPPPAASSSSFRGQRRQSAVQPSRNRQSSDQRRERRRLQESETDNQEAQSKRRRKKKEKKRIPKRPVGELLLGDTTKIIRVRSAKSISWNNYKYISDARPSLLKGSPCIMSYDYDAGMVETVERLRAFKNTQERPKTYYELKKTLERNFSIVRSNLLKETLKEQMREVLEKMFMLRTALMVRNITSRMLIAGESDNMEDYKIDFKPV